MDFWFSIGSTYLYLTVMRLAKVAEAKDVTIRWRPFDVRHVMTVQNNIPFKDKPEKSAHMWRDIERRAAAHGLSPRIPAPYPLAQLNLANRVALIGLRDGWGKAYVQETYRLWFEEGIPAGEAPNIDASIAKASADPETVLKEAHLDETGTALMSETEQAMKAGVFGVPSFVVGDDLFWGDDRLDDAISWAKTGRVASPGRGA